MPDVLELARFRVAPEDEQAMLDSRPAFLAAALQHFDGLKSVHLARLDDGTYVDVAIWESRDDCQAAIDTCMRYPAVAEFLSLIGEDLGMEYGEVLDGAQREPSAARA